MSLTAGTASLVSVSNQTASVTVAVATSGTAPYTYQWYRSTTTGFSPGGGNILSGATSRALSDTGLIPNVQYYYVNVVTDSASPTPATANSTQLAVMTLNLPQSQNQFAQSSLLGSVDMPYSFNTHPVQIDATQVGTLYAGAPVKLVANNNGGNLKVIGCAANSDACIGFLNYDIKNVGWAAGQAAEMSMKGNVMYLYSTGAITQGAQVQLDVVNGGVATSTGSSGAEYVGWAYDGAAAAGALIRVYIETPSFKTF